MSSSGRNGHTADGFFVAGSNLDVQYGTDYRGSHGRERPERWLSNTALLQHDHPRIRLLAVRMTQLYLDPRDKALACYRFVQKLPFACAANAPRMPAVEVLLARTGDAYTKSTLLIALLRSVGIPARVHMVKLNPAFLRGIVDTGGRPVDHAFTEVWLGGEWLGVDTYAVDLRLALCAKGKLVMERQRSGYGVHLKGQVTWTGEASSFGHFSCEDPQSVPMLDLGAFDDIQHFRDATHESIRSNWTKMRPWAFAAALANRRIRRLRDPGRET